MNPKFKGKSAEEILKMLTLREKAGQVIVCGIGCWEECQTAMDKKVGSISAVWGHNKEELERFRRDIARLQKEADIPYLVGVDMETGVGQTVHEKSFATEFAEQMALGAIADLEDAKRLAYEEGRVIASEASYLGWNVCYNPVVDVNNNPENPITNIRSVGETVDLVGEITGAMIRGIQEGRHMIALAKHYPGAGMSNVDSHFGLESQQTSLEEMNNTHLMAFRKAVENGVMGMMCNHAIYAMYDEDHVATLSRTIMHDILRNDLGFRGVMYTDSMAMAGLKGAKADVSTTILAIQAGCNQLLGPKEGWDAPEAVEKAVLDGILDEKVLDEAVLYVLKVKEWLGLFNDEEKEPLPKTDGWAVAREISKKSITALKAGGLVPVDFKNKKVLVVEPTHPAMRLDFGLYTNMTLIKEILSRDVPQAELALFDQDCTDEQRAALVEQAKTHDVIIVGTSFRSRSGQVGMLTERQLTALHAIHEANPNVIAIVSNPYVTAQLSFISDVLCCYSTSQVAVEAACNVILGKEKALGKKHVTIPDKLVNAVKIVSHG